MHINYTPSPYTRGIESVNKKFGKPDHRELIVLFGYMSSGKTEFTYFVARKNVAQGVKVCYISLELPEYDMKLRIARKHAGVSKIQFQTGDMTDQQKIRMDIKFEELQSQSDLVIIKPTSSSMDSIMATIKAQRKAGCRMFIVDNLDKIGGKDNDNARYQEISSILQDFKNSTGACIILVHHAKKPTDKVKQYMPAGMSGIRGSQKILDNATQVIEIFRDLDPEIEDWEDKARVTLYQYKDTFEGANGFTDIYFNNSNYEETPGVPF